MQRSRTDRPPSSSETGVASLPEGVPRLKVLVEQARSPSAGRTEVDQLIAALAQPLAPEQPPRERADLMLSLIDDRHLGAFAGSKGQTVRSAAIEALLELGYPYALELPPDALAEHRARSREAGTGAPSRLFTSFKGWAGFSFVTLVGLAQLISALLKVAHLRSDAEFYPIATVIVALQTFLPLFMVTRGHLRGKRALRRLGSFALIIVGLLWAGVGCILTLQHPMGLIPLLVGILLLAGTALMSSVSPED